jgi:hypothetical protein
LLKIISRQELYILKIFAAKDRWSWFVNKTGDQKRYFILK